MLATYVSFPIVLVGWVLTIHTVHAAIGLASLVENPSVADGAVFPGLVTYNARERLRSPYNERLGYTGVATTGPIINVPVTALHDVGDPQARLDLLAHTIGHKYVQIRESPALLGACSKQMEILLSTFKNSP